MSFCSFGPTSQTTHSTTAMQFFKSTTLFALALATCATASVLPRQCTTDGACGGGPGASQCCPGYICNADSSAQPGFVSLFYQNFSGIWDSFVFLVWAGVADAAVICYLSGLQTDVILLYLTVHTRRPVLELSDSEVCDMRWKLDTYRDCRMWILPIPCCFHFRCLGVIKCFFQMSRHLASQVFPNLS